MTPAAGALAAVVACGATPDAILVDDPSRTAARWTLLAVEYAHSHGVPARRLVGRAPREERLDLAWSFFVLAGYGHVLLVDVGTGSLDGPRGQRWSVDWERSVPGALAAVGLRASDVTDVALTHGHWDHVGALGHFGSARVFAAFGADLVSEEGRAAFVQAEREGRLQRLRGEGEEVVSGVRAFAASAHAEGHVVFQVSCAEGVFVIGGDAAWFGRSPTDGAPGAELKRVAELAGDPSRVLLGHDPEMYGTGRGAGVRRFCR